MLNHKFFANFQPAPLSTFFAIAKKLSQPESTRSFYSWMAMALAKRPVIKAG